MPTAGSGSKMRTAPRGVLSNGNVVVGTLIVVGVVLAALAAPWLSPGDPLLITGERLRSPSWAHPMGTDLLGRDVMSRVLYGARLSLGAAALAGLSVMSLGMLAGTAAGYFGGFVDSVIMRLVDVILALPGLVIAFAIAALLEPGILAVLVGLVSVWWVGFARVVRSMVIAVGGREYVTSARAAGASHARVILRHVMPNVTAPVLVLMALRMGRLILAVSGLSFLGLGPQPPTPEWGSMLNEARAGFPSYPHIMLAPGLALMTVVLGLNLLGDGLRDVLDRRGRHAFDTP